MGAIEEKRQALKKCSFAASYRAFRCALKRTSRRGVLRVQHLANDCLLSDTILQ